MGGAPTPKWDPIDPQPEVKFGLAFENERFRHLAADHVVPQVMVHEAAAGDDDRGAPVGPPGALQKIGGRCNAPSKNDPSAEWVA